MNRRPLQALHPFPPGLESYATEEDWQLLYELDDQAASIVCTHPRSELRRRPLSNGSVQIAKQCSVCGESASNPIKKAEAPAFCPDWDDTIRESYRARRDPYTMRRQAFFGLYNRYLQSEEWALKRSLVIERCANLCEGCRNDDVHHVHHLTYDHVGRELLFDLVGLCLRCHEIAHDDETP